MVAVLVLVPHDQLTTEEVMEVVAKCESSETDRSGVTKKIKKIFELVRTRTTLFEYGQNDALNAIQTDCVLTVLQWVPFVGPGSPWGPFSGFGSPFYVLGPLFSLF